MKFSENNFQEINDLYLSVLSAISFKKFSKLKEDLNLIDSVEKLFEKNYTNRKKEGVFYTKKEISDFIFSQALISLLNNMLEPLKVTKFTDLYSLEPKILSKVKKVLLSIRICDPACGSGVFIISAAEMLYDLILKLNLEGDLENLKLTILRNLYGFEINKSALKLSKLKLLRWLFDENFAQLKQTIFILDSNLKLKNSLIELQHDNFDMIIGNPPYGNILKENDKQILKEDDIFYNDIYCAFILKAIDWTDKIIAFLVPKSFLFRQGYVNFRNLLLFKTNLLKIYDVGPNVFKKATNEVQIIIYEKRANNSKDLRVYKYPNSEVILYKNQKVDALRICNNKNCNLYDKTRKVFVYTFQKICPYCFSETSLMNRIRIKPSQEILKIINKIEQKGDLNYLNIQAFPNMIRGEEAKGLKMIKTLIVDNPDKSCLFINAKEDFTYFYFQKNKSLNLDKINAKNLKGNHLEYYINPKLLIKHNNVYPQALFTEEKVCFTSSIYSLLHSDVSELKYLCGILNSIIMQFYCIYGINNQQNTTINLNQYMIRHLPIIHCQQDIKQKIIGRAEKISNELSKYKGILSAQAKQYIKENDNIIFRLYSISNEEKTMIISITKKQIEFFKKIY
ncbi:MAG: Eco57I restriction-modification methylase domain-containing protein [Promethearchaeota archaeon]